ncbi:MAG: hypothetical protein KC800_02955 [Candidatus Eremiobacteraeota bacterium]|nr:hypothetical protein [Candidatus Eremiobacteraeota bacterium]
MSWATIRSALVTRLAAVTGIENVHGQIRYLNDSVDDTRFSNLFLDDNEGLHTWQFTRTNRVEVSCPDDSTKATVTHSVRLLGLLMLSDAGTGSTNSEDTFQALVDTLAEEFRDGFSDSARTLGGACITYSVPTFTVRHASYFNHYLAHEAEATFDVEELVTVGA